MFEDDEEGINTAGINFDPATGKKGPAAGLNEGATLAPAASESFLGKGKYFDGQITHDRSLPNAVDAGLQYIARTYGDKATEGDVPTPRAKPTSVEANPTAAPSSELDDERAIPEDDVPRPRSRPEAPSAGEAVATNDEPAIPETADIPGADKFATEKGWTPEQLNAVLDKVDPEGKMPTDMRMIAGLRGLYEHFVAMGRPDLAQRAAGEFLITVRNVAAKYGERALELARSGDIGGAAAAIREAADIIPDGRSWEYEMDATGNGRYVQRDAQGNVVAEGMFSTREIVALALGLADGQAVLATMMDVGGASPNAKARSGGGAGGSKGGETAAPGEAGIPEDPRTMVPEAGKPSETAWNTAEDDAAGITIAEIGRRERQAPEMGIGPLGPTRVPLGSERVAEARANAEFDQHGDDAATMFNQQRMDTEVRRAREAGEVLRPHTDPEGRATRLSMDPEEPDSFASIFRRMHSEVPTDPVSGGKEVGMARSVSPQQMQRLVSLADEVYQYNGNVAPADIASAIEMLTNTPVKPIVDPQSGKVSVNGIVLTMPYQTLNKIVRERRMNEQARATTQQAAQNGGRGPIPTTTTDKPSNYAQSPSMGMPNRGAEGNRLGLGSRPAMQAPMDMGIPEEPTPSTPHGYPQGYGVGRDDRDMKRGASALSRPGEPTFGQRLPTPAGHDKPTGYGDGMGDMRNQIRGALAPQNETGIPEDGGMWVDPMKSSTPTPNLTAGHDKPGGYDKDVARPMDQRYPRGGTDKPSDYGSKPGFRQGTAVRQQPNFETPSVKTDPRNVYEDKRPVSPEEGAFMEEMRRNIDREPAPTQRTSRAPKSKFKRKSDDVRGRIAALEKELASARKSGDTGRARTIQRQLQELRRSREKLIQTPR